MKIIPYKLGSASAKALADALNIKRVNVNKAGAFKAKILINWGCSHIGRNIVLRGPMLYLNHPENVTKASNKLTTLKILKEKGVFTPLFTESKEEAIRALRDGMDIVVRHKLNGHSGEGIEIVLGEKNNPNFNHQLPNAPLYVEYIPKKEEYRVHVFQGRVLLVQRKARKLEVKDEDVNWKVRNLKGGFIYAGDGVDVDDRCKQLAIDAVAALSLDFGAVDIIWNQKHDAYYVLEVNTAPGLSGRTLEAYKEAFNGLRR